MSKIQKSAVPLAAAMALLVISRPSYAEDMHLGRDADFKFVVGGILASFDTSVGLNGNAGTGTPIDLNSGNDNKNAGNVFLGAQWRFLNRSRISAMYFTTKKTRAVSLDKSIIIGNDTLDPPIDLESTAKNTFLFVTYEYSFLKHDNVEISGLIGLYANKFKFDLSGTGQFDPDGTGGATPVSKDFTYNPSATVPMPLIGASVDYYMGKHVALRGSLSGLKAKIGDVDGSVWVATAGVEYMFTQHFGGGLSYMHTSVDVDVTKKAFDGSLTWKNNNFLLYAIAKF